MPGIFVRFDDNMLDVFSRSLNFRSSYYAGVRVRRGLDACQLLDAMSWNFAFHQCVKWSNGCSRQKTDPTTGARRVRISKVAFQICSSWVLGVSVRAVFHHLLWMVGRPLRKKTGHRFFAGKARL